MPVLFNKNVRVCEDGSRDVVAYLVEGDVLSEGIKCWGWGKALLKECEIRRRGLSYGVALM